MPKNPMQMILQTIMGQQVSTQPENAAPTGRDEMWPSSSPHFEEAKRMFIEAHGEEPATDSDFMEVEEYTTQLENDEIQTDNDPATDAVGKRIIQETAPDIAPTSRWQEMTKTLPACKTEDDSNCYWDAQTMGNGRGKSFIDIDGTVYFEGDEIPE